MPVHHSSTPAAPPTASSSAAASSSSFHYRSVDYGVTDNAPHIDVIRGEENKENDPERKGKGVGKGKRKATVTLESVRKNLRTYDRQVDQIIRDFREVKRDIRRVHLKIDDAPTDSPLSNLYDTDPLNLREFYSMNKPRLFTDGMEPRNDGVPEVAPQPEPVPTSPPNVSRSSPLPPPPRTTAASPLPRPSYGRGHGSPISPILARPGSPASAADSRVIEVTPGACRSISYGRGYKLPE